MATEHTEMKSNENMGNLLPRVMTQVECRQASGMFV